TLDKGSAFLKDGDADAAENLLLDLLKKDSSPAMTLVVADALYSTDPSTSYKLHKKVFEAVPGEYQAILEWAMELHRAGEYAAAIPLYQKILKSDSDHKS